jgi:hypothetical protein
VIAPCVCVVLLIVLASGWGGLAADRAAEDARTQRLLALARDALGGDAKLSRVQGLTATGEVRRAMTDLDRIAELRIDLQWPARLLRTDSNRAPGSDVTFVMLRGLDAGTLLRHSKILNGGPGHRMSQPPIVGGTEALALRSARHELLRFALSLLLMSPTGADLQFAHRGLAEASEGQADILDVTGADGFAARLFLDSASHRPLMLSYRDYDPRFIVPPKPGNPPGAVTANATSLVDLTWYLDDYTDVAGLKLPHRIARAIDGEPDEEWTFTRFVVNPTFKADAFRDR